MMMKVIALALAALALANVAAAQTTPPPAAPNCITCKTGVTAKPFTLVCLPGSEKWPAGKTFVVHAARGDTEASLRAAWCGEQPEKVACASGPDGKPIPGTRFILVPVNVPKADRPGYAKAKCEVAVPPPKPKADVTPAPPVVQPAVCEGGSRILRLHVRHKEDLRRDHYALVSSRENGGEREYRGDDDISRRYGAAIVASSKPFVGLVNLTVMLDGKVHATRSVTSGVVDISLPPVSHPREFVGVIPSGRPVSYPHKNPQGVHLLGLPTDKDPWRECVKQAVVVVR